VAAAVAAMGGVVVQLVMPIQMTHSGAHPTLQGTGIDVPLRSADPQALTLVMKMQPWAGRNSLKSPKAQGTAASYEAKGQGKAVVVLRV
jgi:hypothetical protein